MSRDKNILVLIGARGGSKGVKGKNIRLLAGCPLITYTIKQALRWGKAKRVVVSTDSPQIAAVARKAGAAVPFLRPAELAQDATPKGLAIRHALIACEKIFKEKYAIVVDLDATAPIRRIKDIEACYQLFRRQKPQTLFSVVLAHKNPYFNMVEKNRYGKIELCKKLKKKVFRRQDGPKVYAMNASIYFYDRNYVLRSKYPSPLSRKTEIYIMDDVCGIDIDREIDFQYVEFLMKQGLVKL